MRLFAAARLLLSATLLGAAAAHHIQLPAHGRECYHENLHRDDTMTVTFQVGDREFGSAGNLDVDFWVSAVGDDLITKSGILLPALPATCRPDIFDR